MGCGLNILGLYLIFHHFEDDSSGFLNLATLIIGLCLLFDGDSIAKRLFGTNRDDQNTHS